MESEGCENCQLFLSGSFPVSIFLPEGDLDLVLVAPLGESSSEQSSMKYILQMLQALCTHAAASNVLSNDGGGPSFSIKNVEFVNARTKLVHCTVNTIGVDITVNQVGALLTASFLEDVDRFIGHDHLFKRTLLLIKVSAVLCSLAQLIPSLCLYCIFDLRRFAYKLPFLVPATVAAVLVLP